jgi:hypothetical protein
VNINQLKVTLTLLDIPYEIYTDYIFVNFDKVILPKVDRRKIKKFIIRLLNDNKFKWDVSGNTNRLLIQLKKE